MISPSSINTFFSCPLRWKWMKEGKEGIPIDDTLMRLGSMIHYTIKVYYERVSDNPTPDEITNKALDTLNEVYDDSLSHKRKQAFSLINSFIDFEKKRLKTWKKYKPDLVEQRIVLDNDLVGIVDFYSENTIIDWKTGSYYYID